LAYIGCEGGSESSNLFYRQREEEGKSDTEEDEDDEDEDEEENSGSDDLSSTDGEDDKSQG